MKITYEKEGFVKFLDKDSKLIPTLIKEGWKEVKKKPVKKKNTVD